MLLVLDLLLLYFELCLLVGLNLLFQFLPDLLGLQGSLQFSGVVLVDDLGIWTLLQRGVLRHHHRFLGLVVDGLQERVLEQFLMKNRHRG